MGDIGFDLTIEQLDHLINMGVVVSKDTARPTLTAIQGEVKDGELVIVGTDSYRMGVVVLRLESDESKGKFLLNHAELSRALKWLRAEANATDLENGLRRQVRFSFGFSDDCVTVTGSWPSRVDLPIFSVRRVDATFPDWKQLFGGPWRANARGSDSFEGRVGFEGMKLPAVDAAFLADFDKLLGARRYRDSQFGTAKLSHTGSKGDDTSLKPWCLTSSTVDGGVQVTYLIMPVRS